MENRNAIAEVAGPEQVITEWKENFPKFWPENNYADEESFTLMTPQGHMFAGWITFSAYAKNDKTVVQAQVLMRANDPMYEMGLVMGGHKKEDVFWEHTLGALAAHLGCEGEVETRVVCVDNKRQWARAGNIWHNSAIRSGAYALGAPARAMAKPFRRS